MSIQPEFEAEKQPKTLAERRELEEIQRKQRMAETEARMLQRMANSVSVVKPEPVDNYVEDCRKLAKIVENSKRYLGASFDMPGLIETESLKFMRDEFPQSGRCICLLIGAPGNGKTTAALAYLARYATYFLEYDATNAMFCKAYEVSEWLRNREEKPKVIKLYSKKLLLIDDVGAESGGYKGQDFAALVENVIIRRYEAEKVTILTSNLALERRSEQDSPQFRELYGERLFSRFHDGGCVLEATDKDLRLEKSQKGTR